MSRTFCGTVGVPYGVAVVPADHCDGPTALIARTVNVYAVPLASPLMRCAIPAAPAP